MALSEWYANREILLTGVTSEVGRALLEKILRCFSNVKVYVLIRTRNGLNKDERIKKLFATDRYERLRQEDPEAINRVKTLEGNLLYDEIGLCNTDKATLKNISVVFHAGGPHESLFEFSQDLPRLEVLAAISSIFRHRGQINEVLQNERVPDGPFALVRIPFVGPAYREPMPGYVEDIRGPTAMMIGAGIALGRPELDAQVIPIDLTVNTLVATAWERGTQKNVKGPTVYNAATIGCTWNDLIEKGRRGRRTFSYPTFGIHGMTSNVTLHWLVVLLLEWLPSFLCDMILTMFGAKQRILQEHWRVRNALRSLESISSRPWSAEKNRVYQLQERLSPEEQDAFPLVADIDIESYVLCAAAAARKYCSDQTNTRLVKTFRRTFILFVVVTICYTLFRSYYVSEKAHLDSLKI